MISRPLYSVLLALGVAVGWSLVSYGLHLNVYVGIGFGILIGLHFGVRE